MPDPPVAPVSVRVAPVPLQTEVAPLIDPAVGVPVHAGTGVHVNVVPDAGEMVVEMVEPALLAIPGTAPDQLALLADTLL